MESATQGQNDNEAKRTKTSLRSYLRKHGVNNLSKDDLTLDTNNTYKLYTKKQTIEITNKIVFDTHKLFTTIAHTSGLRTEAILKLRWKHIQEEYDTQEYIHLNFEPQFLRKEKAVSPYAFIGPDSKKLIEKLIQVGTITKLPDSPIIPLAYNSINKAVARVKRKIIIKENINTLHGFRFYFIETLRKVEPSIDYDDQKVMAAHEIKRTRLRYTLQDLEKYRNLYKQAYPYLSINAQPTDKKLSELETKYVQLQGKLNDVTIRLGEANLDRMISIKTLELLATMQRKSDTEQPVAELLAIMREAIPPELRNEFDNDFKVKWREFLEKNPKIPLTKTIMRTQVQQ